MKKYFKVLIALVCVIACIVALASCGETCPHTNTEAIGAAKTPVGVETGMTEGKQCADCGAILEAQQEFYRVSFIYSCKAEITDGSGTKIKDVETEVAYFDFPKDNNNGFTEEDETSIKAMAYHGYTFKGWHTAWNKSTQEPAGAAYTFPKQQITANAKVYVERGNRAGENVTWELKLIPGSTDYELVISGTGAMFDLAYADGIDMPWHSSRNKITKLTVESGVTTIGANAFSGLTKLVNLNLADTITLIGESAFAGDEKIRTVTMPAGVTVIKKNAFIDCSGLKNVVLNEGLKTIEQLAFYGDKAITSIILPASLESIGNGAFHPGVNDKGEVLAHSLKKVFYRGASMDDFNAIEISMDNKWLADFTTIYCYTEDETEGVTGSYWYLDGGIPVQYTVSISYLISGLKDPIAVDYVTVTPVKNNGAIVVDNYGNVKDYEGFIEQSNVVFRDTLSYHGYKFAKFNGGDFELGEAVATDKTVTCDRGAILSDGGGIYFERSDSNRKDTIKYDILTIKVSADGESSKRMWDFEIAGDIAVYGEGAVDNLKNFTTLIIESGVEYIGKNAFADLIGVVEVVIPATVTEIHPDAFNGCTNLVSIYYEGTSLDNCENITALIETPAKAYAKTATAVSTEGSYWMMVDEKIVAWKLDGGTLTVSGDSDMVDFATPDAAPWFGAKSAITSVVIETNVVNVGENIVNGYTGLTSITLHNSIRDVPASAFAGTGIVNDATKYNNGMLIVDGVLLKVKSDSAANARLFKTTRDIRVIAGGAFDGCTNVKELYIVKGIIYMNADAFTGLSLETVYFETKAGMDKAINSSTFATGVDTYYYSASDADGAFHYDNDGNFVLW